MDVSEEIVWRVDSKIAEVRHTNGSIKKNLRFDYDAMGNRIAKHIYADNAFTQWENSTYYVRDASGNVMATYEREATGQSPPSSFRVAERHLYGSSRLGIDATPHEFIATSYTSSPEAERSLGEKHYEISNHLGNVLSVITDQKLPVVDASTVVSYAAVVLSATDYSPFGVGLYGRSWSEGYRFGFNGMEKDDEFKGEGNSYDFGARIYNPRIARWLSVDPLAHKFPNISPYAAMNNNPLYWVDPDGRENIPALIWAAKNMANKGIPFDTWYGGNGGWTFKKGKVPTETVCYESCWTSYMNGADANTMQTLKTGFSTKGGAFKGRSHDTGGMNWFKEGDGTDRQFVTDISKGELGDIVFMGEVGDMAGHAVLLASDITTGTTTIDGKEVNTMSFYVLTTSSDTDSGNYGGELITWTQQENGEWTGSHGGYTFRGYGQMTNVTATDEQKQEATKLIEEVKKGN